MKNNPSNSLRYGMLLPLALLIASLAASCFSFFNAKQEIRNDLNDAMFALANENSELWTRQDTIVTLRRIHEITRQPMICQATDVNFRNRMLNNQAYFTLTLVDRKNRLIEISGNKIESDSIMLLPRGSSDGVAVRVQGFVDCSMASLFAASDQRLPGLLLTLSLLSMVSIAMMRRKEAPLSVASDSLSSVKLTPMQRQLVQMLLNSPDMRVDKATLCLTLWGGKSNAEESLYTLVRRTKNALSDSKVEIICNRGDSYELRIND